MAKKAAVNGVSLARDNATTAGEDVFTATVTCAKGSHAVSAFLLSPVGPKGMGGPSPPSGGTGSTFIFTFFPSAPSGDYTARVHFIPDDDQESRIVHVP